MSVTRIFTIWFAVVLSGCIATAPTNQNSTSPSTPKWEPIVKGSDIATDVNYKYYPDEMKLNNEMLLRGETWNSYLKDYIESFPIKKRDAILNGLTRFHTEYDKVDRVIRFEPLRYMSGPYASNSYISLQGKLTKSRAQALLKIYYYGDSWIFADSITVVADNFTWKSPELKFYRDHYTKVWEYTFFDINKQEFRKLADKIISSKESIIRFHGKQYYSDLQVSERMKKDLSAMLKAIDSINGKS